MNKRNNLIKIWVAVTVLGLAILACGPTPAVTTPEPQQPPSQPVNDNNNVPATSRADLIMATVQIFGCQLSGGDITPIYVGSGSIISSTGMILTNAHVALPSAVGETGLDPDVLVIGIVQSEDAPPVYSYRAEVAAIDGYMDLAVLQITSTLKGEYLDPSALNLPYVTVGDSEAIHVGDHINIFGFPAIGGDTITYTSGNVAGFSSDETLGDRAWIKTDATISGGNSGGMSTDDQGKLIGVPTIASSGANTAPTDCRVIQDTNGDGNLDDRDTCIPIGGFINALRPVNLAKPLIKAAQSGMAYSSPYDSSSNPPQSEATGSEQIGPISWFAVDSQGNIADEVGAYPSGSKVLVGLFNFAGFANGETWGELWSLNGETIFSDTYPWDQGSEGNYGTSLSNQGDPLMDGTYHLEIYAGSGNAPLSAADVVVGTGSSNTVPGDAADIQVSGTVTDKATGNPIAGAYVFVLTSGTTYDYWSSMNFPMDDVLTYAQTDAYGRYVMPDKLYRNVSYTLVGSASDYYDVYGDGLVWTDSDPAKYVLDLSLSK